MLLPFPLRGWCKMTRITVTKEFSWDMSHMLAGHEGLCKNLHGHTYKMHVEVSGLNGVLKDDNPSSKGMVIDFKHLKEVVKNSIVDKLDHGFMYWSNSTDEVEHQIANILKMNNRKVIEVGYRPTAEEMVSNFYQILSEKLRALDTELISIKLWETPSSFAEIRREV
jgi:6-pyruvoyltetrahydropterin/6-carboxytetrahydropterin synthase